MAKFPDPKAVYIPGTIPEAGQSADVLDMPDEIISPELKALVREARERVKGLPPVQWVVLPPPESTR